jgi:hypothetical protein
MQFQITLMHVNVGYKPCLVKNLMCTYMYVEFRRHQCILIHDFQLPTPFQAQNEQKE